jgi:hypothetical protein
MKSLPGYHEFLATNPKPELIQQATLEFNTFITSKGLKVENVEDCKFNEVMSKKILLPAVHQRMCEWGCGNSNSNHFFHFDYENLLAVKDQINQTLKNENLILPAQSIKIKLYTENGDVKYSDFKDSVRTTIQDHSGGRDLSRLKEFLDSIDVEQMEENKFFDNVVMETINRNYADRFYDKYGKPLKKKQRELVLQELLPQGISGVGYKGFRYSYVFELPNGDRVVPGENYTVKKAGISCVVRDPVEKGDYLGEWKSKNYVEMTEAEKKSIEKNSGIQSFLDDLVRSCNERSDHDEVLAKENETGRIDRIRQEAIFQIVKIAHEKGMSLDEIKKCRYAFPAGMVRGEYTNQMGYADVINKINESGIVYQGFIQENPPPVKRFNVMTNLEPDLHQEWFSRHLLSLTDETYKKQDAYFRTLKVKKEFQTQGIKDYSTTHIQKPLDDNADHPASMVFEKRANVGSYRYQVLKIKVQECSTK